MEFVGIIKHIDPSDGMVDYVLEDETGSLKLKSIIDPSSRSAAVNLESVVRVICSPKTIGGVKTAIAIRIIPLSMDEDEVGVIGPLELQKFKKKKPKKNQF
jgi:hypothetical protein